MTSRGRIQAVVVVGLAAGLLNATAATMNRAVNTLEIVSYSLIVLIGLRLLWVKGGRALIGGAGQPSSSRRRRGRRDACAS